MIGTKWWLNRTCPKGKLSIRIACPDFFPLVPRQAAHDYCCTLLETQLSRNNKVTPFTWLLIPLLTARF